VGFVAMVIAEPVLLKSPVVPADPSQDNACRLPHLIREDL
jgi:hypothetical protein